MNYIIVAPHSYCLTFKTRVCDKLAYKAAQFFAEFFNSKNQAHVLMLPSTIPRSLQDSNRKEGRDSPLRKQLRIEVNNRTNPFVLECHSFYDKNKLYDIYTGFKDNNVYMISDYAKKNKLYDKLGEKYIIISGIDNDIQKEMRNMGIPTILIEFYEGLPMKELQKLCTDIGKELVEFYINNNN